jgi:hypothetical protein
MTVRGTLTVILLVVLLFATAAYGKNLERAVSQSGRETITLTDSREGCEWNEAAKRAVYQGPQGDIPGCYLKVDEVVYLIFENGQALQLPANLFKSVGV